MASNLRTWRRPWDSQPQGLAPLSEEGWRVWLPDGQAMRSNDETGPTTISASNSRISISAFGRVFDSRFSTFSFPLGQSFSSHWTAVAHLSYSATGTSQTGIFDGGVSGTYTAFRLDWVTGSGLRLSRVGASTITGTPIAVPVAAMQSGVTCVVTYDASSTVLTLFTEYGTDSITAASGDPFSRFRVGSGGGGAWVGLGLTARVAFLTPEPAAANLVLNPWRVLQPRRIWVPVSAGGGGTTISVPPGSLALTGFAPTVSATANQTIAVPAGALTLAGFAPTVNVGANQTISVPAGSLTMTGFAPTVNVGVNQNIAVPAGSLSLTGFAPTISTSANQSIAVPVGSLTLTGFAPTVVQTAHQTINVPLGTLVMAGYAPTVSASGSYTISVPLGALVLTGFAPVVNNSGATVTVTVKLGSWIRYKKITAAVSTLYGLDPTLNTGFFSYSGTNNLILTKLASSAANYLARSSAAKSSGLRYFAFVNTSEAANDGTHIGVVQSSCPLSYPGADANGYGCQINRAAGVGLWNAGSFTSLGGSALVGVGDTGMMAVNFTLGYIWYGRNGTWFNSGDPAAGTGPNQTFAPGTTFYAAVSEAYISVRTCYSLSGAPYAPPSGFSYWDA